MQSACLRVVLSFRDQLAGFLQGFVDDLALYFHQLLHPGLQDMILLVISFGDGTRYDQRRTRIIDQDAVDLIHHGEVMPALHHLFGIVDHIITQVVEAEFIVRSVGDVALVGLSAGFAVRVVLVDAINGEAQPFEKRAVPFTVPACQVVVHRDDVHTFPGQCVQVCGERGN